MSTRLFGLVLATILLAGLQSVQAQQQVKVPRIGYLAARSSPEPRDERFRRGLRNFGYIEGKNDDWNGLVRKLFWRQSRIEISAA